MSNDPTTSGRLKAFVESIERLEEEKRGISEDISEKYKDAKSCGFDAKIIREIVKRRRMSAQEREEHDALLDLYQASIGMLNGTPLGNAALDRLTKKKPPEDANQMDIEEAIEQPETKEEAPSPENIAEAREAGEADAREGKPVTSNPYAARDPRRAAYDEGWCQAAGTDGMDIPDAWKPTKKEKKKDGDSDGV